MKAGSPPAPWFASRLSAGSQRHGKKWKNWRRLPSSLSPIISPAAQILQRLKIADSLMEITMSC